MSGYDEMSHLPEFDEITQLQIDEFATSIGAATNAEGVIVIVQTDKALQCAMHSRGMSEAQSKMELIRAMCMVAGSSLSGATNGTFQLLIREPNGRMDLACPEDTTAVMGRRPRD